MYIIIITIIIIIITIIIIIKSIELLPEICSVHSMPCATVINNTNTN